MKEGYSLQAVLLKGVRNGSRMRQVFIQYLGSIRQQRIEKIPARITFWEKVNQKLSMLNLEPEVKQSIVEMIQKKVAKPGDLEIREFNDLICARRQARLARMNHHDDI
jgi:hypothetical protein